jgi:hypothetical protein
MCPRLFVLAGILPGCWQETRLDACTEPVYTELADDEESPLGMTANDLLAIATPGWEGKGVDVNDAEADVAWALERGEGSAVFADIEETTVIVRRRFGLGPDSYFQSLLSCDDWLEVPAALSIVSEAAGIDHSMDAALRSPLSYSPSSEEGVDVIAIEPYADAGIVVPGIDESFPEQTIEAWISKEPDGTSTGSLSWVGYSDNQARTVRIVSWPEKSIAN